MTNYSSRLLAVGGAHTGIAPVNLLDVQDTNGNLHYWSDRPSNAPNVITSAPADLIVPRGAGSGAGGGIAVWTGPISLKKSSNSSQFYATNKNETLEAPVLPKGAVISAVYAVITGKVACTGCGGFVISAPGMTQPTGSFSGTLWSENLVATSDGSGVFSFIAYVGYYPDEGPGLIDFDLKGYMCVVYSLPGVSYSGGQNYAGETYGGGPYLPWLVGVPQFSFHRSLQTDVGAFVIQNLSGDTLSRDFEKIVRRSTLEGAMFVYRCYQADAQDSWLEVHGTLTLDPIGVDTAILKGAQLLNPSQDDTPLEIYCETCQLQWGGARCGSTQATECNYSYQSCQSLSRIMVAMNNYEKNYGEAAANTALNVINRRRTI